MKLVSAAQMREIERIAIEEIGIPSILLMENASLAAARHCLCFLEGKESPKVMIFCGSGNNGGDGMALGRHLYTKGVNVKVFYLGDINAAKGDPAVYLGIIRKLGIQIETSLPRYYRDCPSEILEYDLIVDAMLGTGLDRNVEGKYADAIELINKHAKHVISLDIPSGIHSDTGRIMGCALKAAQTVTFGLPKIGLYAHPGADYAGEVIVEDISLPVNLFDRSEQLSAFDKIKANAEILTNSEAARLLPVRKTRSNKGSFGKVVVFAGCDEMPGAASLACSAAYTIGAGLVCACVLPDTAKAIHKWQREIVTRILPGKNGMYCKESAQAAAGELTKAAVIILGPGIGRSGDVTEFVQEILNMAQGPVFSKPVVLDADALFAVSQDLNTLKTLKAPCVITPHPGEMSRLTGLAVSEILNDPVTAAVNFARQYNVITLLKDARTVIAQPNGDFYINTTGCSALAKAGTGDVLAGMIAGFIAQGCEPFAAAKLSAYIHGKAGEAAAQEKSNYSVAASDVIKYVPQVVNGLSNSVMYT